MTSVESHLESERLASAAHQALRAGDTEAARELFSRAAVAEVQAYRVTDKERPRTTGILAVSAAALWYKSGKLQEAERFAHEASGLPHLPSFARQQLRELLQAIWNERAQLEAGISFAPGQVMISVQGGQVVTGGAPLDLILNKVQVVQNLFYRIAEYLSDVPHRVKGSASKMIQDLYRPWLFQSVPGSYQFTVAIQKPLQQEMFPRGEIEPQQITDKFLEIIRACNDDPSSLAETVQNTDYQETFLKMTRNLAPTGKLFSKMVVRGAGEHGSVILTPASRKIISETLRPANIRSETPEEESVIRGNLRAVDLDRDWLELSVNGVTQHISGLSDTVDDLIGPMVNHDVCVRVKNGRSRKLLFVDIELDD